MKLPRARTTLQPNTQHVTKCLAGADCMIYVEADAAWDPAGPAAVVPSPPFLRGSRFTPRRPPFDASLRSRASHIASSLTGDLGRISSFHGRRRPRIKAPLRSDVAFLDRFLSVTAARH